MRIHGLSGEVTLAVILNVKLTIFLSLVLFMASGAALAHEDQPAAIPAPADPDTVLATVQLPADWPDPLAVQVRPDTLYVGLPAQLRLAFSGGALESRLGDMGGAEALADSLVDLSFDQEWLFWDRQDQPARVQGDTLVLPVTVYQINPFQVQAGQAVSPVQLVGLRTEGMDQTARIRDPRRWGWNYLTILLGALAVAVVVVLALWAWTARQVAAETLAQWAAPTPAWLVAGPEICALLDEGLVQRGDGRRFMDSLAGICRRYLASRFAVGAAEMTGGEIARACRQRGFAPADYSPFIDLLNETDAARYNPSPLLATACLETLRRLVQCMDKVRIVPRFTPVAADALLAGEKAWARLQQELPATAAARQETEFAPRSPDEGRP